jgi:hypothetical protein
VKKVVYRLAVPDIGVHHLLSSLEQTIHCSTPKCRVLGITRLPCPGIYDLSWESAIPTVKRSVALTDRPRAKNVAKMSGRRRKDDMQHHRIRKTFSDTNCRLGVRVMRKRIST